MNRKIDGQVVKYFLLAAALILAVRYFDILLGGAVKIWHIGAPLALGGVIAYVLNIVMRRLERLYFPASQKAAVQRTRRPVCLAGSLLLIVAVLLVVIRLVVPELVEAFAIIGKAIPPYFERALDWIAANAASFPEAAKHLENLQVDWNSLGDSVWNYLKTGVGGILNSTVTIVGSLVSAVTNFVIALIFALYILCSKEKLAGQGKRLVRAFFKPEWIRAGKRILKTADETFSSFIVGQCTEAVILGTLCTAGMLICRFPYAPMIGAFVGVTALIPIVGAYLGAGVGAFMILTQDPLKAVLFIGFILILQQVEGNLIYPRVVGSSIGLPGMWVLAAVTVGGGLMGIGGMLLGVPTAATFYKLLGHCVRDRNQALGRRGQKAGQ